LVALRERLTGGSVEDRSVSNFSPTTSIRVAKNNGMWSKSDRAAPRTEAVPVDRVVAIENRPRPLSALSANANRRAFLKFFSPEDPPGISCRGVIVSFRQVPTLRCEPSYTFAQPDRLVVQTSIDSRVRTNSYTARKIMSLPPGVRTRWNSSRAVGDNEGDARR
jgi:hypothetical protein